MKHSHQQGKVCLIELCPHKAHFFVDALTHFFQQKQVLLISELQSVGTLIKSGDLVILDVYRCKQIAGEQLLTQLVSFGAIVYVIDPEPSVETIRQYLATGVGGYADREAPIEQLLLGIASAWAGNIDIPRIMISGLIAVNNRLTSNSHSGAIKTRVGSELPSQREMDVLNLIVQGKTTIEMSKLLFISEATIESHRSHLLQRFQVTNTASLVREAMIRIPELGAVRER